jgi:ribosomal protein L12E/L44/L45/RPP1/RPP2
MSSAVRMKKLSELDSLMNDPNVLLDAARVWELLAELSGQEDDAFSPRAQAGAANPASAA